MSSAAGTAKIAFLVSYPIAEKPTWNLELHEALKAQGVHSDVLPWRAPTPSIEKISEYTHILFLCCSHYIDFIEEFQRFINNVLIPAQDQKPGIRIMNDPYVTLWNSNKIYLSELQDAGFVEIPKTLFFSPSQPIDYMKYALASRSTNDPVVIKPSISASSLSTHLIKDPHLLTDEDENFLRDFARQPRSGSIMFQEFIPDIKRGEYSLIFINGKFHRAYLKVPPDQEFRASARFDASFDILENSDVPEKALSVSQELWHYVKEAVSVNCAGSGKSELMYARVDGVVTANGNFVLVEIELIEPSLGLGRDKGDEIIKALCDAILKT